MNKWDCFISMHYLYILFLFFLFAGATAQPDSIDCTFTASTSSTMTAPAEVFDKIFVVKEPHIAIEAIEQNARNIILSCPEIEQAWYKLSRAWEMIQSSHQVNRGEAMKMASFEPLKLGSMSFSSFSSISEEAFRRFPDSPRLALLALRANPSLTRAQTLADRFPDFLPLKISLAQACLSANNPAQALVILRGDARLDDVPDAAVTKAGCMLAKKDFLGALSQLSHQTDPVFSTFPGYEGYSCVIDCAEISLKADLGLQRFSAADKELVIISEYDDTLVRSIIGGQPENIRRALVKAIGAAKLTSMEKKSLKALLTSQTPSPDSGR
jgi:hypothetical protein